ncbi:MAG: iron-sulfur cluster-binding domain-containing protein [Rivularia sp. (in: cyanobacteria)]
MMSMSRWLCDTIPNADITFVHSAKTVRDIIFRQELELMASRNLYFQLAVTLTGGEYNPNWLGYTGRLNQRMMKAISPDFQERTVYICGSDGFREGVKAILQELEFPMQNYHEESFGSSKKRKKVKVADNVPKHFHSAPFNTVPNNNKSNAVVFTKSKQEVVCDDGETILEVAQRKGIALPFGCQMGACGQCKVRKISGEVSYEEDFDCEDEYVLTCVAKAKGSLVIEG